MHVMSGLIYQRFNLAFNHISRRELQYYSTVMIYIYLILLERISFFSVLQGCFSSGLGTFVQVKGLNFDSATRTSWFFHFQLFRCTPSAAFGIIVLLYDLISPSFGCQTDALTHMVSSMTPRYLGHKPKTITLPWPCVTMDDHIHLCRPTFFFHLGNQSKVILSLRRHEL